MKFTAFSSKKWIYYLAAFMIPFIGVLFLMFISGSAPFGNKSFLYSDMYHQYYPFFVAYRDALVNGKSLLYSWNVGMGMDYLGLVSYYLASPLYLLGVLVPKNWLLGYFSILLPVKLGFAGLFFAIFLDHVFHKTDLAVPLFSAFYALCAWALGYLWNIIWLDTFALLPLVALGAVSLLKTRKFILYTLCLFLSVFSNYYVGLFTCIFVLLLVICYEVCQWGGFVKLLNDIALMAVFSLLAIGMTAILELPAFMALQTTQASINEFPKGVQFNITDTDTWLGLLDAMRQVAGNMNGGLLPTFKEGLPNIYCGVGTTMLAFLFLTCKEIRIRDKICSVLLLLFFIISFIVRQLDYIWHGFHFTNMIPYRFSFLYSFVLLVMAYRAYLLRENFRLWQVIVAGIFSVGIFIANIRGETVSFAVYNIILIILFFSIFLISTCKEKILDKKTQQIASVPLHSPRNVTLALSAVFTLEIILNLSNFCTNFAGGDVSDYPMKKSDTEAVIAYMEDLSQDDHFYRAETTHAQILNDAALNGYNGISTFTSSANKNVTQFMEQLGYGAKQSYNRYCFEESSPVANLFLDLKYMIHRDGVREEDIFFKPIYQSGDVTLLENKKYLPLGFLANSQLINVDFTEDVTPFMFQNELFSAATGVNDDVWEYMRGYCLTITAENQLTSLPMSGYCTYDLTGKAKDTIVYSYDVQQAGFACFNIHQSKRNSFSVYKNGQWLYTETYSIPQMLAIGDVAKGDVVEIRIHCSAGESGSVSIQAATVNENAFTKGYEKLASSVLEIDSFKETKINGHISCDRSGVLYTSIPQNGNWIAYVDGKPADIIKIGDTMVGLLLSQGEHSITFQYKNTAFYTGAIISAVCFTAFAVLVFLDRRNRKRYNQW